MKCKVKKLDNRKFTDYIRAKGLKHSEKRTAIVKFFLKKDLHLSVDELYREIKETNPEIGYSTVYRTLKLLVDARLATERKFGDKSARFEPIHPEEHHDHLICIKCGRIIEFTNDQIEKLQQQVGRKYNFRIIRHKLELYGYCDKCRKKER